MALIDNLIAYYKLDENAANTTVADSHGSNTATSPTNTSNLFDVSGKINSAFDLDGSTEYVDIATNLGISSYPFSFSAWFKTSNSDPGGDSIVDFAYSAVSNVNYSVDIIDGNLRLFARNTGPDGPFGSAVADGNFHHIVVVFASNTDRKLYLDGNTTPDITATASISFNSNVNRFSIGRFGDSNPSNYFLGLIDEVGVWNRVLTTSDVTELYNSGNGLAYPFSAVGTNLQINISDVWKSVPAVQINISDVWKEVVGMQLNIGDTWREIF